MTRSRSDSSWSDSDSVPTIRHFPELPAAILTARRVQQIDAEWRPVCNDAISLSGTVGAKKSLV